VWLSVIVSSTGDGMFITAFPLLAATLTSSPVLIAGITIASRLPWLLFSMVTGAIADRMDRRRLMIGADVVRFVIVGVLGTLILVDAANIWLLYLCAFLLGTGETLHTNSAQAILPALVEPADLLQANARFGAAQIASAQFAGPPLGSILFDAARSLPFLADAVSFAGSAVLIRRIPDVHAVEPPTTRLRDDVREGLRFLWHNAAMRRLTAILALINFFYFAATSLLVLYNRDVLHAGEYTYSALFVAAATGTVLSRFFVHALTARIGTTATIAAAMWLWALSIGGLALTSTRLVAIAMYLLLGLGTGLWLTLNTTLRQQLTPARLLGRMNAAYRTVSWGVVPFGAAFGGIVAGWWGLRAPFVIATLVLGVLAAASPIVLRPVRAAAATVAGEVAVAH
jgi:predicted MFS family arabinose efflux permease